MNGTNTITLSQRLQNLLSPAEHFAHLKTNAAAIEGQAWQEIRHWHEPIPSEIDCGFVDPDKVRDAVEEICRAYSVESAAETVLLYLYLKHRALFLTHAVNFYDFDGGFHFSPPIDGGYDSMSGIGYCGCSGVVGDIVDFDTLDPAAIPFRTDYPATRLWNQLRSDHGLGLGLISYGKAAEEAIAILREAMAAHAGKQAHLPILDNLAHWARRIEDQHRMMLNCIALVTHAVLLQAMQKQ